MYEIYYHFVMPLKYQKVLMDNEVEEHFVWVCKVGALAIIGCLNWGLIGIANVNLVDQIFGAGSGLTRVVYVLVGLSGLALLVSYFVVCPQCKK